MNLSPIKRVIDIKDVTISIFSRQVFGLLNITWTPLYFEFLLFSQEFIAVDKGDQVADVLKVSSSTSRKCVIWLILKNDSHQIRMVARERDDTYVSMPSSSFSSSGFTNISTTSIPKSDIPAQKKTPLFSDSQRALHTNNNSSNIDKSGNTTSKDDPRRRNINVLHPSHPPITQNSTINVSRHSGVNVLDPLGTNPSEKDHEIDSYLRYSSSRYCLWYYYDWLNLHLLPTFILSRDFLHFNSVMIFC